MSSSLQRILTLSLVFLLSACIARYGDRGYTRTSADFDKVIVGTSTNKDVLELLGSPSSYSTFGEETWYYISTREESMAFFKPEVVDQNATAIVFDANGTVKAVHKFTKENQRDIAVSADKTPTEGNRITLWQQLLGNLGRFNAEGGGLPGQHGNGGSVPK